MSNPQHLKILQDHVQALAHRNELMRLKPVGGWMGDVADLAYAGAKAIGAGINYTARGLKKLMPSSDAASQPQNQQKNNAVPYRSGAGNRLMMQPFGSQPASF